MCAVSTENQHIGIIPWDMGRMVVHRRSIQDVAFCLLSYLTHSACRKTQ